MKPNSLGLTKLPADTKVCVAMSGGVDSSVTAYLLKKQGYDVFGVTMDLLQPPYAPATSSVADAEKVAKKLGIPHLFLDLRDAFKRQVIDYFVNAYRKGLTPSPCIRCNQAIKLGLLADRAFDYGADLIVTGHYADIRISPQGTELHKGKNPAKDQSYFLFNIRKEVLQKFRCPLADYDKSDVRALAAEAGLEIATKADSQDICFVPDGDYARLIGMLAPDFRYTEGDIVHVDGRILGRHKGIVNYTVGQRRGLGIGGGDILYVVKIDAENNRVIVGPQSALLRREAVLTDINWLGDNLPQSMELSVKFRSRQKEVPAQVFFDGREATVRLYEDFAGIAPGQGCCFYDGSRVMGGGIIAKY